MRSASVPCGISSASIFPASYRSVNGDGTDGCGDAVNAAWIFATRPSFTSTPESMRSSCQRPGVLEMSVSSLAPCR